jgi:hypothetical protein
MTARTCPQGATEFRFACAPDLTLLTGKSAGGPV